MKTAVIVFPGSNCDRDMAVALTKATGREATYVWHKESTLPEGLDLVALPGGFSFGDFLRCGAIAARSPIMDAVRNFAAKGGHVLGVCNGFQVMVEAGILPGILMQNADIRFICKTVGLEVVTAESAFTNAYKPGEGIALPVAHHEGNYVADAALQSQLEQEGRVAFRYLDNPNGSVGRIAGVLSQNRRCLGMMPHPERAIEPAHGNQDGARLFSSLLESVVAAN